MKKEKRELLLLIFMVCALIYSSLLLLLKDYSNMTMFDYPSVVCFAIAIFASVLGIVGLLLQIKKNKIDKD